MDTHPRGLRETKPRTNGSKPRRKEVDHIHLQETSFAHDRNGNGKKDPRQHRESVFRSMPNGADGTDLRKVATTGPNPRGGKRKQVLPDPLWIRLGRDVPGRQDAQNPIERLLVVWERGEKSRHCIFVECEAWALQIKTLWKMLGKPAAETPSGPTVRTLSQEEKATPAVLTFLRKPQVGRFATLAALGGGRGVEVPAEVEGEEGGG